MLFKIFRFIRYQYQRKTAKPDFYGVYKKFEEVIDQNPWNKETWVVGNVSKISRVKEGHFLSEKPGDVADQTHIMTLFVQWKHSTINKSELVIIFSNCLSFTESISFPILRQQAPHPVHGNIEFI
jgi:hypothetical protein